MGKVTDHEKMIIVGAGILGASTAYQLAKMGAEVLVIDRKDKGQATHAAKGIICPWLSPRRDQAWYRLAKDGARFYPRFIEELRKKARRTLVMLKSVLSVFIKI